MLMAKLTNLVADLLPGISMRWDDPEADRFVAITQEIHTVKNPFGFIRVARLSIRGGSQRTITFANDHSTWRSICNMFV